MINILSLVLSVFSSVFSIIVWRYPNPVPLFIITRDYLIVMSLVSVSIALATRRSVLRYRFSKNVNHWLEHYRHSQVMLSGYKRLTFGYGYSAVRRSKSLSEEELTYFRSVCEQVTGGAREALKEYIHLKGIDISEDVCVTVKLIVKSEEIEHIKGLDPSIKQLAQDKDQWVYTAYRDSHTYTHKQERRKNDSNRLYDISTNTAFHDIFEVGRLYYFSNDLVSMEDKYTNASENWQKYYNATIVVPIQCDRVEGDEKMYFGFLAADSLNPSKENIYDAEGCLIIIQHAADMLANFFMTISLYKYQPTNDNSDLSTTASGRSA